MTSSFSSTGSSTSSRASADYLTTSGGAVRVFRANTGGCGPDLVVLPGLVASALFTARRLGAACPSWRVTVIELPGIGGSSSVEVQAPTQTAGVLAEALDALGIAGGALMAVDLSATLATALAALLPALGRPLLLDHGKAAQWLAHGNGLGTTPSPFALRHDGGHLLALWSHFRDRNMLDAGDPTRVARTGDPLPGDDELDAAVIAAAVRPEAYRALWDVCAAGFGAAAGQVLIDAAELPARLAERAAVLPTTTALTAEESSATSTPTSIADGPELRVPSTAIRYGYLQTPSGRVHMRRAGRSEAGVRPLLVFHSAPGSAGPLEALIQGLAAGREVIACDYLGNGDSDKAEGVVDIAVLARHGLEIIDALGLDTVDLFGTHTGAMIAMEMAICWPERVGRMVLEAPVLIDPDFASDILQHYLPPIVPDRWGTHLLKAWNMRRDMFLFWPWYRQERSAARSLGTPPLQTLHDWTVGLLKSGTTYDLSYRSAFVYDTRARLPLLPCPAMVCAGPADMLVEGLALARQLAPEGTIVMPTPATVWYPGQSDEAVSQTIAAYDAFLRHA